MRTVVEQPRVSRALDDAKDRWKRAQDAWDTVLWVIARDAEGAGKALTESGAIRSFTLDGARSIELPTVIVVYEIGTLKSSSMTLYFRRRFTGKPGVHRQNGPFRPSRLFVF